MFFLDSIIFKPITVQMHSTSADLSVTGELDLLFFLSEVACNITLTVHHDISTVVHHRNEDNIYEIMRPSRTKSSELIRYI